MERQKKTMSDTDSRSSNARSRDPESTGFSASCTEDQALSSSVLFTDRRDQPLGIVSPTHGINDPLSQYYDTLWGQASQLPATNKLMMQSAFQEERSKGVATVTRGSFSGTELLPENYNGSSFQFAGEMQDPFHAGKQPQWRKCEEFERDISCPALMPTGTTSRLTTSSTILEVQKMPTRISSSSEGNVDSESCAPAEKRLRSMMQVNNEGRKHESFVVSQLNQSDDSAAVPQPNFQIEALGGLQTLDAEPLDIIANASLSLEWERQRWISAQESARPTQTPQILNHLRGLGSFVGTRELTSMEQLLVQCASALEANDVAYAQQIIFAIKSIASLDGDPNQRLLAYFLRALILRASKLMPHMLVGHDQGPLRCNKLKTALELTNYVDVMPWYRFGFIAANGAILDAFEGKDKVHILDFNTSHCMQWPTLIEALSERHEGPPKLRLTVCMAKPPVPPQLDVTYDDLVIRLARFARRKNVPFEYQLLSQDCEKLDPSMIDIRDGEVLAVNCLFRLHYVADDSPEPSSLSPRDEVLRFIRNLNPAIITVTEDDANLTSPKLLSRLKAAFNYLWIPFDALHTLLPQESEQRMHYEGEVASKIENIIACEGRQRVERVETKDRWVQRMKKARFEMISFSEDVVTENKLMLGEHSGCWGLRKDEDEDVLFLTWKGHNVSFSTVWVPADHPTRPTI